MSVSGAPNTLAVGQAIVNYMQTLVANDKLVYTLVKLGEIKDVTSTIATQGTACLEIYAATDNSQHMAFGGIVWDTQSWFLLSMVNIDDVGLAEELICQVRDALIVPIQQHTRLGDAGNIFFAKIKPSSGKFLDLARNNQYVRAHIIEVFTYSQWQVTLTD